MGNHFAFEKSIVGAIVMRVCRPLIVSSHIGLGLLAMCRTQWMNLEQWGSWTAVVQEIAPDHHATEYLNRKGYFFYGYASFTDIHVGCSGKCMTLISLKHRTVKKSTNSNFLFQPVCYHWWCWNASSDLGGPYLPLEPLTHEAVHQSPGCTKERFNFWFSRCRMTVVCAFGRLKRLWRCVFTRSVLSEKNIPMVIVACCGPHNICEASEKNCC